VFEGVFTQSLISSYSGSDRHLADTIAIHYCIRLPVLRDIGCIAITMASFRHTADSLDQKKEALHLPKDIRQR